MNINNLKSIIYEELDKIKNIDENEVTIKIKDGYIKIFLNDTLISYWSIGA